MTEPVTTARTDAQARAGLLRRAGARVGALLSTPRRRIVAGATVTTLVLVSAGGAVYAATRTDDGQYRTAVAENAGISETLSLTGEVAAASSRDVAFQVDGTVGTVLTELGAQVAAGQTLATLDTSSLDDAVTSAEDTLARAQEQLEEDLEAQQNGGSTGTGSTPSGGAPTGSATGGAPSGGTQADTGGTTGSDVPPSDSDTTDPAVTKAVDAVAAAQVALLAQYQLVQDAQTASSVSLAAAQSVCQPFLDASLETGEETQPDVGDPAEGTEADAAAAASADSQAADLQQLLAQCQQSLTDTQSAQESTTAAQAALTDRATDLDAAVAALQELLADDEEEPSTEPSAGPSSSGGNVVGSGTVQTSSVQTTAVQTSSVQTAADSGGVDPGDSVGASAEVTAETVLADQAQVDAAEAALAIAERNRNLAELTSPIDGTVIFVAMAVGDEVSAGSTDAVITVQAAGGYIVEATVSLSKIEGVEVGQMATAELPAFASTYDAEVSSVGVANVSETSAPSYTVVIAIDAGDDALRVGATAQVTVTLASVEDVLTVPISAVSRSDSGVTVTVLEDDGPQVVPVEIGAVGTERVEIVSGLTVGDRVVLADLIQAVVGDESGTDTGLTGLGGGSDRGVTGGFPDGDFQPPEGFQPPGG